MSISSDTPSDPDVYVHRLSQKDPTPDDPHWNVLVALGMWVFSVLAIAMVPMLFLLPYVIVHGPDITQNQALGEFLQQDRTAIILQIIAIIPAHLITLAIAWAIVTRLRTYSFKETVGWQSGGMTWWHHVAILVAFFFVAGIVGNYFPEQENELTRMLKSSRAAVFLVAFMATFTAPIVEEVIYRGIVYSALQRTLGVGAAVITVTLLFAAVHVPQYYPSYSTISLLLLLSLVLTLVRVKTGNLWPCIVLHTLFNGVQSVLLILEPYVKPVDPVVGETAIALLK
jgi:membrane protease YdiL (CAAX protease family)